MTHTNTEAVSDERLAEIVTDADNFYRPEIKSMATELQSRRAANSAGGVEVKALVDYLWQEICELPDRSSPEDYPDMGLVNLKELTAIVETWAERSALAPAVEAEPVARGRHLWVMEEIAATLLTGDRAAAMKLREAIDFFSHPSSPVSAEVTDIEDRAEALYRGRAGMSAQDELGLGCTCERCNKPVTYDLIIPDDAWTRIGPRPVDGWKGGGILCPECIVTSLIAERDGLARDLAAQIAGHQLTAKQSTDNLMRANTATAKLDEVENRARKYWQAFRDLRLEIIGDGPMCRDCADENGRCPHSGQPCDPDEAVKEKLASWLAAEAQLKAAREAALEEAAHLVEGMRLLIWAEPTSGSGEPAIAAPAQHAVAASIRALSLAVICG